MASNNWNNPTIGETHVDILSELKGRDVDVIKMIDDETPTNLPEKAKRWDDSLKVFRSWISAIWTTLILAIAGGGTGANTAAGARTNLAVDSSTEVDGKIATHQALYNPHGSVSTATPNRLVLRDAAGRAAVVGPSAEGDIALKSNVTTVQGNLDTHAALANPHGAVSAPTVNKLMLRDASGRAQVEDPSADKDIVNLQTLAAVKPAGQLFLSAAGGWPSTTAGCESNALAELSTNKVNLFTLNFDPSTVENAEFTVVMPSDWDGETITAVFYWMHAATTTNFGVMWQIAGRSYANDDALDQAVGTLQEVSDTGGTTNDLYVTAATPDVTIAGAGASEMVQFKVNRNPADAADNLAVDAKLIGVMITYART